jgi:hypothetical protein
LKEENELLDESKPVQENGEQKPLKFYVNRGVIYLIIIYLVSLVINGYFLLSGLDLFIMTLYQTAVIICIAFPIEAIRKLIRDRKNRKKGIEVIDQPFGFHIAESALSLMIIHHVVLILYFGLVG